MSALGKVVAAAQARPAVPVPEARSWVLGHDSHGAPVTPEARLTAQLALAVSSSSAEPEDGDWDGAGWDEVSEHLQSASPWFAKVMRGESPGEPDSQVGLAGVSGYVREEHGRLEQVGSYHRSGPGLMEPVSEGTVREHMATAHGIGYDFGNLSGAALLERHGRMHTDVPFVNHSHAQPDLEGESRGRLPGWELRDFLAAVSMPPAPRLGALSRVAGAEVALTPRTAEASTVPQPTVPPGGPGLFHIKGRELPPYIQHLYKHLVGRYGKHGAYRVAVGIVKKWKEGVHPGGKAGKKGGHRVHADVQAAAAKNWAQWERDKADAHKDSKHVKASNMGLAQVRGYQRVEHGKEEFVRPHLEAAHKALGTARDSLWPEERWEDAQRHVAEAVAHMRQAGLTDDPQTFIHLHLLTERGAELHSAKGRKGPLVRNAENVRMSGAALQQIIEQRLSGGERSVSLAAPAAWPSGKPYKQSLLPPGPTTGLPQGSQTRTGVIVNGPGTKPALYGQLRQAPAQTAGAGPPLPPGVTLPAPQDLERLGGKVPEGADEALANSVRKHLHAAAEKLRAGDRTEALRALRSAQTGVHAAYRAAAAANMPATAQVYGVRTLVPPAEQSSATNEMLAGRKLEESYRALHHEIATYIDTFRRAHFHGQVSHMAEARFTAEQDVRELALAFGRVRGFRRTEHGREEEVRPYTRQEHESIRWWRTRMRPAHATYPYVAGSATSGSPSEVWDANAGRIGSVERRGMLWHPRHLDGAELEGRASAHIAARALADYHNQMIDRPHADPERVRELEAELLGIEAPLQVMYRVDPTEGAHTPAERQARQMAMFAGTPLLERIREYTRRGPHGPEHVREAERAEPGPGDPRDATARMTGQELWDMQRQGGPDRYWATLELDNRGQPGHHWQGTVGLDSGPRHMTAPEAITAFGQLRAALRVQGMTGHEVQEELRGRLSGWPGYQREAVLRYVDGGVLSHAVTGLDVPSRKQGALFSSSALDRMGARAGPNPHGAAGAIYK